MTDGEVEDVRKFVRKYTTVQGGTAGSKGGKDEPDDFPEVMPSGYFAFACGKNSRLAKNGDRPSLVWGDFERTYANVVRRIEHALADEEGHVFLRAYFQNVKHFDDQIRINGVVSQRDAMEDLPEVPTVSQGGPLAAMAMMLGRELERKGRENTELHNRSVQMQEALLKLTQEATMQGVLVHMHEHSAGQNNLQVAADALKPFLTSLTPAITMWLTGQALQGLPEDPLARITELVQRIQGLTNHLGKDIQANQDVVNANPAIMKPVLDIAMYIVGQFGMKVVQK